ncbi:MAG: hypothetical protein UV73_C0009G0046 [Candidatus Gottesmanbacteria bacterium GW2011_GWA2_43_14]|uniref:Uncharacterized protein n=1 Tax=Candidatus Gottesmanbacteria bacterium GW2011_GWA2_43_14 TaxID=1618443 RepID=A0A0G1DFN4_9BACT|nr:MAG: hypothetical protein UV73_C0009G0046 [Candidatus Gottesmanbacteria bacterium GW2011_GWA2_43_14]
MPTVKNEGFTIIEIVVTIGIILVLLGISFSGYATVSRRQKLTTSGQNLKNMLRDVQSRAYNGEVDCSVCDCDVDSQVFFEGWLVDFNNREFFGSCNGNQYLLTKLGIDPEVNISANPWVTRFSDDPPGIDEDSVICLYLDDLPGRFYGINISRSGDISDSGGIATSCP